LEGGLSQRRQRHGRVRYEVRWRDGGVQRSRTFDLRRDADAFERELKRRLAMGAHAPAEPSRELLGDYLLRWWEQESPRLKPSSRRGWRSLLNRWILPHLGAVRLRDLGVARVRQWRAEIQAGGCSNSAANRALAALSSALSAAVDDDLIPTNPCFRLKALPEARARRRPIPPLDLERIRALMGPCPTPVGTPTRAC
jgi:hypothetical protein